MCCAGYDANISYCPNCGSNSWRKIWTSLDISKPLFECDCGWKGVQSKLLTKRQFLKSKRKIKLVSLLEFIQ